MSDSNFTHLDDQGAARMVDVGEKGVSRRTAVAQAVCSMESATAEAIRDQGSKKGDVLQVARIAAIGAAKRTDELIPLCHNIPLDRVSVEFNWPDDDELRVEVTASATGRTGVEMEALTAASVAALTVYDMCKSMDRSMEIHSVYLLSKSGGQRGEYQRPSNARRSSDSEEPPTSKGGYSEEEE